MSSSPSAAMTPLLLMSLALLIHVPDSWACSDDNVDNEICLDTMVTRIDEFAQHMLRCNPSPALTLAVVKDGKTLLVKGYGKASTKRAEPVSSRTKFAIGSLTKAFTATLVSKWVREYKNITFDTPISQFFPDFRVTDDMRSEQATLRDLLSHRMAVPQYFKPLMMGFPTDMTRDYLMRRLAWMPSDISFRGRFIYNNYMYTLAAYVLEQMSGGRTWEDMVRHTFFEPLNMTQSGFVTELVDFSEFALPCAMMDGALVDLPGELLSTVIPLGPAGSIYSNAEDMSKWLQFLLAEGLGPGGVAVVPPDVIRKTLEPGSLFKLSFSEFRRPKHSFSHVVQSYGMGWVTANYRGYQHIYHTGGIVTHSSRLWLFPDVSAGIYVSVNGPQLAKDKYNLLEPLMYFISDILLGEPPWLNHTSACHFMERFRGETITNSSHSSTSSFLKTAPTTDITVTNITTTNNDDNNNISNNNSSIYTPGLTTHANESVSYSGLELNQFANRYFHECFGHINVTVDGETSRLVLRFGRFGVVDLQRLSDLEFRGQFVGVLEFYNSPGKWEERVWFTRNQEGEVGTLVYLMDSDHGEVRFSRRFNDVEDSSSCHECVANNNGVATIAVSCCLQLAVAIVMSVALILV